MSGSRKPSLEFVVNICCSAGVSANWLLGLPEHGAPAALPAKVTAGGSVTIANAPGATASTVGGDCARCQLMIEHIKAITGRG